MSDAGPLEAKPEDERKQRFFVSEEVSPVAWRRDGRVRCDREEHLREGQGRVT